MSLKEYNEKRDFSKTKEPKGKVKRGCGAKRFVVQYHEARAKHYDFRLEYNGVLISFAVPKGLSYDPKVKRLAVMVEDHPLDYIDFEGVIPNGNYGAGTVMVYDKGVYMPIEDLSRGLKKGHIKVALFGEKLKGGWSFIKTGGDNWIVVKLEDEYVSTENNKTSKGESVPFSSFRVQLATLASSIPKNGGYIYEIKQDGFRIVARKEKGKVTLLTRNNLDYTDKFKEISGAIGKLVADGLVLDGEVVAFDEEGRSDFGLLGKQLKSRKGDFRYVVFDLLSLKGEDLRSFPLEKRKAKLEVLLHGADDRLIYSTHVLDGVECYEFAKKHGLEGVICKKIGSKYTGGRNEDWLKVKCYKRQEFVIGGFTVTEKNETLSAVLVGLYSGDKFYYVGKVGSGFSGDDKLELVKKLVKRKTSPFCNKSQAGEGVVWVRPSVVVEVQFSEFTAEGVLRQPSFIGLREDKDAKSVVKEVEL